MFVSRTTIKNLFNTLSKQSIFPQDSFLEITGGNKHRHYLTKTHASKHFSTRLVCACTPFKTSCLVTPRENVCACVGIDYEYLLRSRKVYNGSRRHWLVIYYSTYTRKNVIYLFYTIKIQMVY